MDRRTDEHESTLDRSRRLIQDSKATQERLRLALERLQRAIDEPLTGQPQEVRRER